MYLFIELKLKPLDPTYMSDLNINIKSKFYLLKFYFYFQNSMESRKLNLNAL